MEQREIKFRAWDGEAMIELKNAGLQYFDFEGSYVLSFAVDGYDGFWAHEQYESASKKASKYPIMQYTGLKDKNEIEIYEGDILCVHEENGEDYIHSVEWGGDYPAFTLKPSTEAEYNDLQHACTVVSCEVIGNIHANPELTQQS